MYRTSRDTLKMVRGFLNSGLLGQASRTLFYAEGNEKPTIAEIESFFSPKELRALEGELGDHEDDLYV